MFDDFDTMRQSDEYFQEIIETDYNYFSHLDNENEGHFSKEEQEIIHQAINKKAIDTGINIFNYF